MDKSSTSQNDPALGMGVNAPMLDEKTLKPEIRSIKDGEQAYAVASALEHANEPRNQKNAVIWRKYNGDPPYNQKALVEAEQGWRSNASFGFLSGIVSRVVPAPIQIIDSARYLTSASLKAKGEDSAKKSEAFRQIITKAIRQWDGWKSFNYELAQEDCLMGAAIVAWLDEDTPWPRFFRLDEAFVPDGTLQHANAVQLFVAKQDWLIHEAVEFISVGRDEAEKAGWDVDAMVETINEAMPKNMQGDTVGGQARLYEDTIREGNIGISHSTGAKVISAYQILAVETSGKVTQYIVDRKGLHRTLFQKDDRYEKMGDCLTLFTLEPGNGKFYSSKGIGRMIVNQHIAIERLRNVAIDNTFLSGLIIWQGDAASAPQMQTYVKHPFIITTTGAKIVEEQIESKVGDFLQLDSKITQLAEIAAGAYMPDKLSDTGERDKTATEANIDATRENQARLAFLARYWGQFGDMISVLQKRLCKSDSSDEDAKEVKQALQDEGLTTEEIKELAECPAAEVVQDMTQQLNSQKVQVFTSLRGDPRANQGALYQMGVTAMATPEVADSVLIPEEFDQSVEAEAMRLQLLESAAIQIGDSIPVSPRDNHAIHLQTIAGQLKQAWPGLQKADPANLPTLLDNVSALMHHAQAHIEEWKKLGAKPEEVKPFQQALDMAEKGVQELAQKVQQHQMQQPAPPQSGAPPVDPQLEATHAKISEGMNYKDMPEDIKRQMEAAAGFVPSKLGPAAPASPAQTANMVQQVSDMSTQANSAPSLPPPTPGPTSPTETPTPEAPKS